MESKRLNEIQRAEMESAERESGVLDLAFIEYESDFLCAACDSLSSNQASATLRAKDRILAIILVLSVTDITPLASNKLNVWLHLRT